MGRIKCVLDACSIINLTQIDEDDFLLNRSKAVDLFICDLAYSEIKGNIYERAITKIQGFGRRTDIASARKSIDQRMTHLRRFIHLKDVIDHDFPDYWNELMSLSGYRKDNGEFQSVGLSLYLSRVHSEMIFFFTDDYPAKNYFHPFFLFQQIGAIEDSIDFLVLVYRLSDEQTFSKNKLDGFLSSLYQECAEDVRALRDDIDAFYSNNLSKLSRNLRLDLNLLIQKLRDLDIAGVSGLVERLMNTGKPDLKRILAKYPSIKYLDTGDRNDFLTKIRQTRKKLQRADIFRIA